MKKIKKFVAIAMAAVMVFALGSVAFAGMVNTNGTTNAGDTGTITVSGLEGGVTVDAYQIAKATYDSNGNFTGYEMTVSGDFDFVIDSDGSYDKGALTEANLAAIMAAIETAGTAASAEVQDVNGDSAELTGLSVGSYLIVVSGSESSTYALMIGSVSYTTDDGSWTIDNGEISATSDENIWAKKTTPTVDKEEVNADDEETHGDSANVGDEVTYHIHVGPIPAYYGDYPIFDVVDELSGLTITADELAAITVTVVESADTTSGGTSLTENTDYTVTATSDNSGFDVNFVVEGNYTLNEYAGQYLLITYSATVTDDAAYEGAGSDEANHSNDATLHFSPTSYVYMADEDAPTTDDETYEYTFKVSTTKVGVKGSDDATPLEGASFALYTDAACETPYTQNNEAVTATSGADGTLSFSGLAEGTYYMKETSAPAGYVLSETVYTITITAEINETDGTLTSYEITIKNGDETVTQIVNTEINGNLPSTGGRGTLIFTLIGCAIVVCAVVGVAATRRRRAA